MTLCQNRPINKKSKNFLGFHKNCGGIVNSGKYGNRKTVTCGGCNTRAIHPTDILQERPDFKHQRKAGISRKIPRYDIRSWKDVKE